MICPEFQPFFDLNQRAIYPGALFSRTFRLTSTGCIPQITQ